jgi:hypothetical protein
MMHIKCRCCKAVFESDNEDDAVQELCEDCLDEALISDAAELSDDDFVMEVPLAD